MTDVAITVRGNHTSFLPPQRATVTLSVGFETAEKAAALQAACAAAAEITGVLAGLHDPHSGPVTWWANDRVLTWTEVPLAKDGSRRPPVHHAVMTVRAKFSDFAELERFLGWASERTGVSIMPIQWALTEAGKGELQRAARVAAIADARDRAEQYAAALGLTQLRVVAVADPGLLGVTSGTGYTTAVGTHFRGGGGPAGINLNPEDITVESTVELRFVAVG